MSSPSMYTLVDRVDDAGTPTRKRASVTRFQVPAGIGMDTTSIRQPFPDVHSTPESNPDADYSFINNDDETSVNHDNILFVCLDLHSQLSSNLIASLRAINNDVQTYTDLSSCFNLLQSSHDRIFFITSSADKQLLDEVHNLNAIEAIFILNSEAYIDSRYPKLYGVYGYFEELLKALKDTVEWFEQTQMELFVFERDRIFFWSQLWKEEFIKPKKSKISSNKEKLVHVAENYYRGNLRLNQLITDFNQAYTKSDAVQWCFSSPFPSRFVRRTLCSHNPEHLNACQFLLMDVSRIIQQQSNRKTSCELYRGMKATNEFLEKLENHTGKLICPKGFLLCSQSRKTALEIASSLDHRPDLIPVLFKITYDTSVPIVEVPMKGGAPLITFDIFTVFRVKYVNRSQVSIVKIEPADEDGINLTRQYRMKHESESIQNLLDQLLILPKPPVRLPPLQHSSLPLCVSPDLSTDGVSLSIIPEGDDEMQAQEFVNHGQIDEAIAIFQRSKPESARVFTNIGILYAEKKGDYDSAIIYYKKAIKIQEKKGEDVTDTLSRLGIVHHNRQEFDLALSCYSRALHLRKKAGPVDQAAVANSLIGMANAYWGQQNLSEALNHAQQALTLNESFETGNDLNIAVNLAILANIYYNSGDPLRALELATRALGLLERCTPSDSLELASIVNNVATIQVANGLFADARRTYDRALEICRKILPEGHPKRIAMETNIQRITEMERRNEKNS